MSEDPQNLRSTFSNAEEKRKTLEKSSDSNTANYQENLLAAIRLYEQSRDVSDKIALFSPNESLEDISSTDLQ